MHGFSVYLGQPINQRYIDNLISLGYDTIFTSIQIPEEDETTKLIYLQQLLSYKIVQLLTLSMYNLRYSINNSMTYCINIKILVF